MKTWALAFLLAITCMNGMAADNQDSSAGGRNPEVDHSVLVVALVDSEDAARFHITVANYLISIGIDALSESENQTLSSADMSLATALEIGAKLGVRSVVYLELLTEQMTRDGSIDVKCLRPTGELLWSTWINANSFGGHAWRKLQSQLATQVGRACLPRRSRVSSQRAP
jgi:hypothetical protein